MQDQIVVLKNTKQGIELDTVYSSNDTLFIDFNGKSTIEIPDKRIEVNAYTDKDAWDIVLIICTIIGVAAAAWAAHSAYKQLKKENLESQQQIDHLAKLREIDEKRLRLMVKPTLRVGERGHAGRREVWFNMTNEGNRCHIDEITQINGRDQVIIGGLNRTPELRKDVRIEFRGSVQVDLHPNQIEFRLRVLYHDEGEYQYESIIHWNQQNLTIETNEL